MFRRCSATFSFTDFDRAAAGRSFVGRRIIPGQLLPGPGRTKKPRWKRKAERHNFSPCCGRSGQHVGIWKSRMPGYDLPSSPAPLSNGTMCEWMDVDGLWPTCSPIFMLNDRVRADAYLHFPKPLIPKKLFGQGWSKTRWWSSTNCLDFCLWWVEHKDPTNFCRGMSPPKTYMYAT